VFGILWNQGSRISSQVFPEEMKPKNFDQWRIFPRLLITLYGIAFWRTTEWFMSLPEPTNAQSAFVSVIVGAGAAWFGLYVGGSKQASVKIIKKD
jgi:hypothetical protein